MLQRLLITLLLCVVSLGTASTVHANPICNWFGYCVYESPGFRITVVDGETGTPLADVHALAEWNQYGFHGSGGPLMVQDAVSGPDGVLTFPAWGPMRGSSGGLELNQDPVITLFKPGYKAMAINNAPGRDEKARVRGFTQSGQIFQMDRFHGTPEEWVKQLETIWLGRALPRNDQMARKFPQYLNRLQKVWEEREKVPSKYHQPGQFFWHVQREIKFYEDNK